MQKQNIAIWGIGLKGTAFIREMDKKHEYIDMIVDTDSNLWGQKYDKDMYINSYEDILTSHIDVVFIVNTNFFEGNSTILKNLGYTGKIIDLDGLIESKENAEEVLNQDIYYAKTKNDFDLSKNKQCLLEILDEVDRVCKKNGITYFLAYGSALGARRHGGFIPWDDDIDIGMERKDYEKFREIAPKEMGEKFYYQRMEKHNDYHRSYDQVGIIATSFVVYEYSKSRQYHGIHIDIFPHDNVPMGEEERNNYQYEVRESVKNISEIRHKNMFESKNIWKKFVVNYKYYLGRFKSFERMNLKMENLLRRYENADTEYITELVTMSKRKLYFPIKDIFPTKCMAFENRMLPVPGNIDAYLSRIYGDYMQLPPVEARNKRHRLFFVSYTEEYPLSGAWRTKYGKQTIYDGEE